MGPIFWPHFFKILKKSDFFQNFWAQCLATFFQNSEKSDFFLNTWAHFWPNKGSTIMKSRMLRTWCRMMQRGPPPPLPLPSNLFVPSLPSLLPSYPSPPYFMVFIHVLIVCMPCFTTTLLSFSISCRMFLCCLPLLFSLSLSLSLSFSFFPLSLSSLSFFFFFSLSLSILSLSLSLSLSLYPSKSLSLSLCLSLSLSL